MCIKKKNVYAVSVSLLSPDRKRPWTNCLSFLFSVTPLLWLHSLPRRPRLFGAAGLSGPLLFSVQRWDLVLTSWSSGACTTPQTRVETGSSHSQSEAWKNGGRRRGCTGGMRWLSLHIISDFLLLTIFVKHASAFSPQFCTFTSI